MDFRAVLRVSFQRQGVAVLYPVGLQSEIHALGFSDTVFGIFGLQYYQDAADRGRQLGFPRCSGTDVFFSGCGYGLGCFASIDADNLQRRRHSMTVPLTLGRRPVDTWQPKKKRGASLLRAQPPYQHSFRRWPCVRWRRKVHPCGKVCRRSPPGCRWRRASRRSCRARRTGR